MSKAKILVFQDAKYAIKEYEELKNKFDVKLCESKSREELFRDFEGKYSDIDGIWKISSTAKYLGDYDKEMVAKLPSSVKIVVSAAAGFNDVDVKSLSERGIILCNTPKGADASTADIAMWLILSAFRQTYAAEKSLRDGKWKPAGGFTGNNPENRTLGILGLGGIGKTLSIRARAFGMKIQYHNRTRLSEAEEVEHSAKYLSFDELLATSDVLFISIPLNEKTKHAISSSEFSKMKDGVIVVNTSRGPVVDEEALVEALKSGKVKSAALDVYEDEPKIHPYLMENEQCILLPHIGGAAHETLHNFELITMDNFVSFFESGKAKSPVNLDDIK